MNNQVKSIQVLGSGCPTCKKLFESTKKVAEELNLSTEVEYVNDIAKMIEMGVMTSPVLAINGKAVLMGGGKSEAEIKEVLLKNIPTEEKPCVNCSSCDCC